MHRILGLFSGVGGFERGLEASGLGKVYWHSEIDEHCNKILKREFPESYSYGAVQFVGHCYATVICGGFPCQDLSDASRRGKDRPGLKGEKSGLWSEYLRIVKTIKPKWVLVENVDGAARKRWVPYVRRDLHEEGYASFVLRLRGFDVGAPFKGGRIFVIATPYSERESTCPVDAQMAILQESARLSWKEWGAPSPEALGVVDGLPRGVHKRRVEMMGNAIVPAMSEAIGHFVKGVERWASSQ